MDLNNVGPCSNCGGSEFTEPSKVGMPAVSMNGQKELEDDYSNICFTEVIVCHSYKQARFFVIENSW